jgi:hypothetical protein
MIFNFTTWFALLISIQVSVSQLRASGVVSTWAGTKDKFGLDSCSYSATCTVNGIEGVCVSISQGCCTGTVNF